MPTSHRPFKITTKKGLSRLYDSLYKAGQRLFDQYQPCNIIPTAKIDIRYGRKKQLMLCFGNEGPGLCCCGSCVHLGHKGCLVKALGCKLSLCSEVDQKHPNLAEKLRNLRNISRSYNLIMFRGTKGRAIRNAMRGLERWNMYRERGYI